MRISDCVKNLTLGCNMKVYKIRLNPEDAKYGLDSKERQAQRFQNTGDTFSQFALDAYNAAKNSTALAIFQSLPTEMQKAIPEIRRILPVVRPDARCSRCQGKGRREDIPNWIVIEGKKLIGKICFKCLGNGIEPCMDPIFFRRRIVDTLSNCWKSQKAIDWAYKVVNTHDNPYRAVMLDVAETILKGNDPKKLPH